MIKREFMYQDYLVILYYEDNQEKAPYLFLHSFEKMGEKIIQQIKRQTEQPFVLIEVISKHWEHHMIPFRENDLELQMDYYCFLESKVMTDARKCLPVKDLECFSIGYSLGGLYSLFSIYMGDLFSKCASISGSLWYPFTKEVLLKLQSQKKPRGVYLSLGKDEGKTKNKRFSSVDEKTNEVYQYFLSENVQTYFEYNPGNHFTNPIDRIVKGIVWLLNSK